MSENDKAIRGKKIIEGGRANKVQRKRCDIAYIAHIYIYTHIRIYLYIYVYMYIYPEELEKRARFLDAARPSF